MTQTFSVNRFNPGIHLFTLKIRHISASTIIDFFFLFFLTFVRHKHNRFSHTNTKAVGFIQHSGYPHDIDVPERHFMFLTHSSIEETKHAEKIFIYI
jgi:hypothetical protein